MELREAIRRPAKKLLRFVAGDYSIYHIYARSRDDSSVSPPPGARAFRVEAIDQQAIAALADPELRDHAWEAGRGVYAYGCFDGARVVGLCFYWHGERYPLRAFWPIDDDEAKLVQLVTLPAMRGRGVASTLIAASAQDVMSRGFRRLFARVWRSNTPSRRAFERAGWRRVALVVELFPLQAAAPLRLTLRRRERVQRG